MARSTEVNDRPSYREFDLVLVGATGFVGALTARHLARSAPDDLRIALAGRSREKLVQVQANLPTAARDWPLMTVDVTDPAQAQALAQRASVIATTVGPYAVYGTELVTACSLAGTHYTDLAGEVLFVHDSVQQQHDRAQASGARIVHACGFDSVPSDLAVMLAAQAAADDEQGRLVDVMLHVRKARGGVSGGTIDSMRQQIIAMKGNSQAQTIVADPDALAAERTAYGRGPGPIGKDPHTQRWYCPFVMSHFNSRIVRRSWSLTQGSAPLLYHEVTDTGQGWKGAATAVGVSAGLAGLFASMATPVTRSVVSRFLPAPGEGPSQQSQAAGMFHLETRAHTSTGARYLATVSAPYDPGYGGTAVMLAEAALALSSGEGSGRTGVLTPATALGDALITRLRTHGFTITVTRS